MMDFDLTEQRKSFHALWNDIVFHVNTGSGRYDLPIIQLIGPKGCGKTRLAQEIARTYPNVLYLSFSGQTQEEALTLFQQMYLPNGLGTGSRCILENTRNRLQTVDLGG